MRVSAGIITCNEEQTIGALLESLLRQTGSEIELVEVIVVSAECRDQTDAIVERYSRRDKRIRLIREPERRGKSAAVNTFLAHRKPSDLTLLMSGDLLIEKDFLSKVGAAFSNPVTGMAGGRPVPVNSSDTLLGSMTNLMWDLHHAVACHHPKLGEAVMFRSDAVQDIPADSPVDEASIESAITGKGLRLHYVPEAVIHNRGPSSLDEWFSQRRRIAYGHAWLKQTSDYNVSTGDTGLIVKSLFAAIAKDFQLLLPGVVLIGCEVTAKIAAWLDVRRGKGHRIWDIARSTKIRLDA